jgi:hypothetical protein
MNRFKNLVVIVSFFLLPGILHAQLYRSYVSGSSGVDSNPCTRLAPCATFAAAYAKTLVGGEIVAIDGGGFAPLTITHAITIDGGGQFAGLIAGQNGTSGDGIDVNVGASDTVVLRNLSIDGNNQAGANGISFTGAGNLIVENCTIEHFLYSGINFSPSSATSTLVVRNASIHNNGSAAIYVGVGYAALDNVHLNYNYWGLLTFSKADVRNSVADGNSTGFCGYNSAGDLSLVHSAAVNNAHYGVLAATGIVRLSDVMLSHNGTALNVWSPGAAFSFGDNQVNGNTNNAFPVTLIPKQ